MAWSWKIGRVAGIPIYIHWTFLILVGWIGISAYLPAHDLAAAAEGVGLILALFGCVVLHELGHALMARRFGVPTADITLLPIGGLARLQRIPEQPSQELLVALAGPAVNVVIVAILLLLGVRIPQEELAGKVGLTTPGYFLPNLLFMNAILVVFNLLPAFPMDGGRVFRALLAMTMDYARATRIAASVGQLLAIGFGFMGLFGAPLLLLIALFVWIGAESEAQQVQERITLRNVPVREAMLTEYHTLSAHDTLGHAAELLLAGSQHDFPVEDQGQPVGVLTRSDLMNGLARGGQGALVSGYVSQEIGVVEAEEWLIPALTRLREGEGPCLQVVEHGRSVGLLTLENIGEYLMVRTALKNASSPGERQQLARTYS